MSFDSQPERPHGRPKTAPHADGPVETHQLHVALQLVCESGCRTRTRSVFTHKLSHQLVLFSRKPFLKSRIGRPPSTRPNSQYAASDFTVAGRIADPASHDRV